jgi:hypothetical protein
MCGFIDVTDMFVPKCVRRSRADHVVCGHVVNLLVYYHRDRYLEEGYRPSANGFACVPVCSAENASRCTEQMGREVKIIVFNPATSGYLAGASRHTVVLRLSFFKDLYLCG